MSGSNADEIEKILLGNKKGLSKNDIDGDMIPDSEDCAPYSSLHHGVVDTIKGKISALREKYNEFKEQAEDVEEEKKEEQMEDIKEKIKQLKEERKKYEEEVKLQRQKRKVEEEKKKLEDKSSGSGIVEKTKEVFDWIAPPEKKTDEKAGRAPTFFEDENFVQVYHDDEEGWVVESQVDGGADRGYYANKTQAKNDGRKLARKLGVTFLVRNKSGKIQENKEYSGGKSGKPTKKTRRSHPFEDTGDEGDLMDIFGGGGSDSKKKSFFEEFG